MWIGALDHCACCPAQGVGVAGSPRGAKVPSSPGLSRLVPASPEEGLCWPQGLKEPPAGPGRGSCVSLAQVVVVQAISALCQKYPRKHAVLMNFLFSMLREEVRAGGLAAGSRAGGPGSTC